jgi:hypothetical protein
VAERFGEGTLVRASVLERKDGADDPNDRRGSRRLLR